MSLECPKCNTGAVHRSRRKFYEHLLTLIGLRPFRCKACDHRFYRFAVSVDHQSL